MGNGEGRECHDDELWITPAKNGNETVMGWDKRILTFFKTGYSKQTLFNMIVDFRLKRIVLLNKNF